MVEANTITNLVECRDCHQRISVNADACPHCGAPTKIKVNVMPARDFSKYTREWRVGAGIGGGLIILLVASFHAGWLNAMWLPFVAGAAGGPWVARSRFKAWARTWLITTILVWTLPVSGIVAAGRIVEETSATEGDFAAAGAAIGVGFGMVAVSAIVFFVGVPLIIVTYLQFKRARDLEREYNARGGAA